MAEAGRLACLLEVSLRRAPQRSWLPNLFGASRRSASQRSESVEATGRRCLGGAASWFAEASAPMCTARRPSRGEGRTLGRRLKSVVTEIRQEPGASPLLEPLLL